MPRTSAWSVAVALVTAWLRTRAVLVEVDSHGGAVLRDANPSDDQPYDYSDSYGYGYAYDYYDGDDLGAESRAGAMCCSWDGGNCGGKGNDGSYWCHDAASNCKACGGTYIQDPSSSSNSSSSSTSSTGGAQHQISVDWVKFYEMDDSTKKLSEKATWEDEFDKCPGGKPDRSTWSYEDFGPNVKNHEAQTYVEDKENAFCEDGILIVRAFCKDGNGCRSVTCSPESCNARPGQITSASIETGYLFNHGRLAARIKVEGELNGSIAKGLWPAFWQLGEDISYNHWPNCGEIDIMEYSEPHGTNGQNVYFEHNPYTNEHAHFLTTEAQISSYPMDEEGYRVYTVEKGVDEQGKPYFKFWVTLKYEDTLDPKAATTVEYPKANMPDDMWGNFTKTFKGKKLNAKINLAIGGNLGGQGPYFS